MTCCGVTAACRRAVSSWVAGCLSRSCIMSKQLNIDHSCYGIGNRKPYQEFMENECEALPGVAYPGVRDYRRTLNTKTGYDDDDILYCMYLIFLHNTEKDQPK